MELRSSSAFWLSGLVPCTLLHTSDGCWRGCPGAARLQVQLELDISLLGVHRHCRFALVVGSFSRLVEHSTGVLQVKLHGQVSPNLC